MKKTITGIDAILYGITMAIVYYILDSFTSFRTSITYPVIRYIIMGLIGVIGYFLFTKVLFRKK
jgi:hypothetical protein